MRRLAPALLVALAATGASAGDIGRDVRVPVATLAASASAEDRALAAAAGAVGLLQCDNGRFASAVLVGERTLVSSAHVFLGVLPAVRAGEVRCRFASAPGAAPVDVDLRRLRLGIERPVTGHNICSNTRDWAVLPLAAPPAGARPVPRAGATPGPGTPAAIGLRGRSKKRERLQRPCRTRARMSENTRNPSRPW